MERIKLSIIVPIYNMTSYLLKFVDSFLVQSSNDFEIIFVNDGSTDNSGVICDEYCKKYPELISVVHKDNGGLSSARNAGIDVAKGDFVVFPDPDDWVEPDYVERFLNLQNEHQVDLVCTGYTIDYDDKQIVPITNDSCLIFSGKEAQKYLLLPPKMNGFAWNKIYRLDLIKKYNLRFLDDVGTTEDLDFVYRYLKYCERVCYAPEYKTYHYYQRAGAATRSSFTVHKMNSLHTYEKIMADTDDVELRRAAKDELVTTTVNLIWLYENSGCKDTKIKRQLLNSLRDNLKEYLMKSRYGTGRKIQAVLAACSPKLFCLIKNSIQK